MAMEQDQAFLEYVVKELVDNPDDVVVNRVVDEMGVLLTLTVHKDDMGKILGRSGATVKSIRTLLRVVGMKNDARVNLKVEEPEGGTRWGENGGDGAAESAPAAPAEPAREKSVDEALADLEE